MITSRSTRRAVIGATALIALLTGCSSAQSASPSPSVSASASASAGGVDAKGCITDFDPSTDYFPVKSQITHATNFAISYHDSYQVLTVPQPTQGGAPESYVLVKCGALSVNLG